jgi:hypothetical protein
MVSADVSPTDAPGEEEVRMSSRLVVLALLGAAFPAAVRSQEFAPPDNLHLPYPLYSEAPVTGGLVIGSGNSLGLSAGPWWMAGWRFVDGSAVNVRWGSGAERPQLTFQRPFYDGEIDRYSSVVGTQGGFRGEWYLGESFALIADLAQPLWQSRIGVHWYLFECLDVMLECDPFWLRVGWGWALCY